MAASASSVYEVNQHFLHKLETDSCGVNQTKPKFPQYAVSTKRKDSYKMWPEYLPLDPDVLVDAGLVYTGVGDSVRCFYCGGGLRNWERGDNPWEEHAKWYPSCPYVDLVKGKEYVERVKKGEKPDIDMPKKEVQETVYDPINTAAAQACVEMGYSEDLVKKAIIVYVKKNGGKLNFKGTDLCEILFDLEEEPESVFSSVSMSCLSLTSQSSSGNVADSTSHITDVEMQDEEEEIETVEELVEENRRLKENQQCKICLDDNASVIFLPCGHMVSCPQCAPALVKCPICRVVVKGVVKAYFATN